MANTVDRKVRIKTIANAIASGMQRKDILEKYGKKWKLKKTSIDNYIKSARILAGKLAKEREKVETELETENLKTSVKLNLITRNEKRDMLSKIIRGELEIFVKKPIWNTSQKKYVMITVPSKPLHSDIMKAIEIDNRMEGHDAPTKVAQTDTKGNDLPVLNFIPTTNLPDDFFEKLNAKD